MQLLILVYMTSSSRVFSPRRRLGQSGAPLILKAYERGSESVGMKLHLYLLAATLIELLVSIPIHIVCEHLRGPGVLVGSDLAISIGVSVLVVAVGPAAYLRYRKPRRAIANPI